THHQAQVCRLGCPEAAPLADDFIVLGDDVIDPPDGIENALELAPVPGQVLGASNRLELPRQEVVNDLGVESVEKMIKDAGIASVEVPQGDGDVVLLDGAHGCSLGRSYVPATPSEGRLGSSSR